MRIFLKERQATNNTPSKILCFLFDLHHASPSPHQYSPAMATLQTRDWAHLPPELLESISVRLTQIPDLVVFSSVCVQWQSAAKSTSSRLPPQFPWLLLPTDDPTATDRLFLNLANGRTYKFALSVYRSKLIHPIPIGCWILTPQRIEILALTNPLTRFSIRLPPLPLPNLRLLFSPRLPPPLLPQSRRSSMGEYELKKAKLLGSNLVAIVFGDDDPSMLFCRLGESSWRRLSVGRHADFGCHDERLFVLTYFYTLLVFDVHTLEWVEEHSLVQLRRRNQDDVYLVESPLGRLLLVRRNPEDERKRFQVFWLDTSGEGIACVELSSIGDDALFVDCVQAMAFRAGDLEGCRGNCVYFLDDGNGVMVFDIEKGEVGRAPLSSFTFRGRWGKAMWIVPSLGWCFNFSDI